MISQDLLAILRCPHCVSGATRRPAPIRAGWSW